MEQTAYQRIVVGFKNEASLQQAVQYFQKENFSSVKGDLVPPVNDAVPRKRTFGPSGIKAAGIGGTVGATIGALIMTVALNIPNQESVYNNATPLFVLVVLIGTTFGAGASGLLSFFTGIEPDRAPTANYKFSIEASAEEIETVTKIVLDSGGHLL